MEAMNVLDRLASAMDRRDEVPNQELAKEIVATGNQAAIDVLVEHLQHKSKAIQNDCIKVLYEVGEQAPAMIAPHWEVFMALLSSKNNRLQWGGMTALGCIAPIEPDLIYQHLGTILAAADKGSVITKDHAVHILIALAAMPAHAESASSLLVEQLLKSAPNQLPMYAERILPIVTDRNKAAFAKALETRLPDVAKESKRKRIEKVLKKLLK